MTKLTSEQQQELIAKLRFVSVEIRGILQELDSITVTDDYCVREKARAIKALHNANDSAGWAERYISALL